MQAVGRESMPLAGPATEAATNGSQDCQQRSQGPDVVPEIPAGFKMSFHFPGFFHCGRACIKGVQLVVERNIGQDGYAQYAAAIQKCGRQQAPERQWPAAVLLVARHGKQQRSAEEPGEKQRVLDGAVDGLHRLDKLRRGKLAQARAHRDGIREKQPGHQSRKCRCQDENTIGWFHE